MMDDEDYVQAHSFRGQSLKGREKALNLLQRFKRTYLLRKTVTNQRPPAQLSLTESVTVFDFFFRGGLHIRNRSF